MIEKNNRVSSIIYRISKLIIIANFVVWSFLMISLPKLTLAATASPSASASPTISASAEASVGPASTGGSSSKYVIISREGLDTYLPLFYTWSISLGGALAVLMIIIGGYEYATSGGDVEKCNQAKEKIIGSILGLMLLVTAYLIVQALHSKGTLTTSTNTSGSASPAATTPAKIVVSPAVTPSPPTPIK